MYVGDDGGEPAPFLDSEGAGHLDQPLYHVEVVVLRVADRHVASVQVHLPRHLLRAAQLHLQRDAGHIQI